MDPTLSAPLNILSPIQQQQMMQQPTGILNGQQAPQQGGGNQLINQAMQLMKQGQPQQQPQMQPIQMAQPVGSQGIDPTKLLQAMQQNKLMSV